MGRWLEWRRCAAVTALLLAGAAAAPVAQADPGGPLYPLVDAAAQRLQTAEAVSASKWITHGSIEDPARVAQVLDGATADARQRGIDPDYVSRAFTNQVHATEGIEYTRFAQWKFDPAAAPTTAPELSASRSTIDGLNKQLVEQMAAQWQLLHSPSCPTELGAARNAVVAARTLDPLYQQALSFATSSYCG
jgi:chorismate mutase